jgi:3-phosphoshikimate 1-carboxyvinyltransferase
VDLVVRRGGHALSGVLVPPPDKSISHRALLGALLCEGETVVEDLSEGLDVVATRRAVEAWGAQIEVLDPRRLLVRSPGLQRLREPGDVIDVGNSGTLARLGLGVGTLVAGTTVLTGDASVRGRPMDRVIGPLRSLGAVASARGGDRFLPAVVRGSRLAGGTVELEVASAQVKSALLLAGLGASGPLSVVEPLPTRPHTEELFAALGLEVGEEVDPAGRHWIHLQPGLPYSPGRLRVLGDPSAAAFFVVAAASRPEAHLEVHNVYLGPSRTGFLEVLARMGATVERLGDQTLVVRGAQLVATEVEPREVPSLIDEVPALAVAFALAEGTSKIRGARELRVKESDRITTTAAMLRAFGAAVHTFDDGLAVHGPVRAGEPREPIVVESHRDHRIAMSAVVAAAVLGVEARVRDAEWITTSYPSFLNDAAALLGVAIEHVEAPAS